MSCKYYDGLIGENVYLPYWDKQPARASLVAPRDYTVAGATISAPGRPVPAPYWFAQNGLGFGRTPPDALATMLFAPQNAERGPWGSTSTRILSPRVFGAIRQANYGATGCDLRFTGPSRTGTPVAAAVGVPTLLTSVVVGSDNTGTITFAEDGTLLTGCAGRPVVGGVAWCATTFTNAGEHHVRATYSGTDTQVTVDDVTVVVSATATTPQRLFGWLVAFAAQFHLLGL